MPTYLEDPSEYAGRVAALVRAQGGAPTADNFNRMSQYVASGQEGDVPVFEQAMQRAVAAPTTRQARMAQAQAPASPAATPPSSVADPGASMHYGPDAPRASSVPVPVARPAADAVVPPEAVQAASSPKEAAVNALAANGITDPAIVERATAGIPDSPPTAAMPQPVTSGDRLRAAADSPIAQAMMQSMLGGAAPMAAAGGMGLIAGARGLAQRMGAGSMQGMDKALSGAPGPTLAARMQGTAPVNTTAAPPVGGQPVPQAAAPAFGRRMDPAQTANITVLPPPGQGTAAFTPAPPQPGFTVLAPPGNPNGALIAQRLRDYDNATRAAQLSQQPAAGPATMLNSKGGTRTFAEQLAAAKRRATVGGRRASSPVPKE